MSSVGDTYSVSSDDNNGVQCRTAGLKELASDEYKEFSIFEDLEADELFELLRTSVRDSQLVASDDENHMQCRTAGLRELNSAEVSLFDDLNADELFELLNFDAPGLESTPSTSRVSEEIGETSREKRRKTSCESSRENIVHEENPPNDEISIKPIVESQCFSELEYQKHLLNFATAMIQSECTRRLVIQYGFKANCNFHYNN